MPKGGGYMAFNPSKDLDEIHKTLRTDARLLDLLDLTGKSNLDIAKRIIRRSKFDDLASNDKRLCIFFLPDRRTRNEVVLESVFDIEIHVPTDQDIDAWRALERVKGLLHRRKVNNKYVKFYGQLGELPTMQGFFCCGGRFIVDRTIN